MNNDLQTATLSYKPLSRRKQSFLNLAQRAAESSECVHKHGAIIVRSGSVLSIGVNKWRNIHTPTQDIFKNGLRSDLSVHAEMDALSRVAMPAGATIYVARVRKNGKPALSKPCKDCAQKLKEAGIAKIIYTVDGE